MPRRNLVERELENIERSISRRLLDSPLAMIGQQLKDLVVQTRASVRAGSMTDVQARVVCLSVSTMLDALPDSFGMRFSFDSALIQSLAEEWSQENLQLSRMIIPCHAKEWGHLTVPMPSVENDQTHAVDVILFPGDDDIAAVDLLNYPWLGHELGHNLHFRVDIFANRFGPRLDQQLTELRTRSIADRGAAKQSAIAAIDAIQQAWQPSRDHKNWAHEIAVDIVALWTCGPAFIFAFDDFVDRIEPDPFHTGQVHPPYHLRALALLDAASRLCWGDFTVSLKQRATYWSNDAPSSYAYALLADEELLVAAVTCGLQACEDVDLPRLTVDRIEELRLAIQRGEPPEFGSDLLVLAWLAERELDESAFEQWHSRTLNELAASVRMESPQ